MLKRMRVWIHHHMFMEAFYQIGGGKNRFCENPVTEMFSKQSVCELKQVSGPHNNTETTACKQPIQTTTTTTTTTIWYKYNHQFRDVCGREADQTEHNNNKHDVSRLTFNLYWPLPSDITIKGCLWLAEIQRFRLNTPNYQSHPVMRHSYIKLDIFMKWSPFKTLFKFPNNFLAKTVQKLSFVSLNWSSCGGTQECKHELQPPRDTWQRGDILWLLPLLVFLGPGVLRAALRAASRMETHSNNFNFWTIWDLFIFYVTASFVRFICISEGHTFLWRLLSTSGRDFQQCLSTTLKNTPEQMKSQPPEIESIQEEKVLKYWSIALIHRMRNSWCSWGLCASQRSLPSV